MESRCTVTNLVPAHLSQWDNNVSSLTTGSAHFSDSAASCWPHNDPPTSYIWSVIRRQDETHERRTLMSDLRTEKTLAILPTARILLRMTSLRIAEVPPGTSPESKVKTRYPISIQRCPLHTELLVLLAFS